MDEYIRREDAISSIRQNHCFYCPHENENHEDIHCHYCDYDEAVGDLEEVPAADVVERKKGKWLQLGKCSECGGSAPFLSMASTYYESDFCPNCGSDMR